MFLAVKFLGIFEKIDLSVKKFLLMEKSFLALQNNLKSFISWENLYQFNLLFK